MKSHKTVFTLSLILMAGMLLMYTTMRKSKIMVREKIQPHQAYAPENQRTELAGYENLLHFGANEGQTADEAKFISRGNGYFLFLTPTEAVIAMRSGDSSNYVLRLQLEGAAA